MVDTDPHITVFVGYKTALSNANFAGHGHLWVTLDKDGIPASLTSQANLRKRSIGNGQNPEIWGNRNNLQHTRGPA